MVRQKWSPDGAYAIFEAIEEAMRSAGPAQRGMVLRALNEHSNELKQAFAEAPSKLHIAQLLDRLRAALTPDPSIPA
jgi:myo-inositol catabolism protein IolC